MGWRFRNFDRKQPTCFVLFCFVLGEWFWWRRIVLKQLRGNGKPGVLLTCQWIHKKPPYFFNELLNVELHAKASEGQTEISAAPDEFGHQMDKWSCSHKWGTLTDFNKDEEDSSRSPPLKLTPFALAVWMWLGTWAASWVQLFYHFLLGKNWRSRKTTSAFSEIKDFRHLVNFKRFESSRASTPALC